MTHVQVRPPSAKSDGGAVLAPEERLRPLAITTPEDIAPIRASVTGARAALDDLRVVSADALSHEPRFTPEAQRADIARYGDALREHLSAARALVEPRPLSVLGVLKGAMRDAAALAESLLAELELPSHADPAAVLDLEARIGRNLVTAAEELDALSGILRQSASAQHRLRLEEPGVTSQRATEPGVAPAEPHVTLLPPPPRGAP